MTVISKLMPRTYQLGKISLRAMHKAQFFAVSLRYSHSQVFKKRQGQMYFNRFKDVIHFYYIGLGFLPMAIVLFVVHTVYGPCQLTDIPEDGPPPHFWQFERTPLRQWYTKWIGISDMEYHERNLSLFEKNSILQRWRRMEQRVKHLQGERWDYKGYFYQPLSSTWIDHARKAQERFFWQYEEHGHNAQ